MKRQIKEIIFVITLLNILLMFIFPRICLAIDTSTYKDIYTTTERDIGKLGTIGNKIIGIIQVVGTGIAVIMLIVIGIKYLMASADEKAQLKGQLTLYIIGAILLFAGSNIFGIIARAAKEWS